jgi:hypothetical protein
MRGKQSLSATHLAGVQDPPKQMRPEPQSEFQAHRSLVGAGQRLPSRGQEMGRQTPPMQLRSSAVPAVSSSPKQLKFSLHCRMRQAPSRQAALPWQSPSEEHALGLQTASTHTCSAGQGLAKLSQPGAFLGDFDLLLLLLWLPQAAAVAISAKIHGVRARPVMGGDCKAIEERRAKRQPRL